MGEAITFPANISPVTVANPLIPAELSSNVAHLDLPPASALTMWQAMWPMMGLVFLSAMGMGVLDTLFALAARRNPGVVPVSLIPRFDQILGFVVLVLSSTIIWFVRDGRENRKQWRSFIERQRDSAAAVQLRACQCLGTLGTLGALGGLVGGSWFFARRKTQLSHIVAATATLRATHVGRVAFVDPSIAQTLALLSAAPGLLEPEEIGWSCNKRQALGILSPFLILTPYAFSVLRSTRPIGFEDVMLISGFLIWTLFALTWLKSMLGKRFVAFKTTRGLVSAGPGWVDDRTGRRWTVEDSVMIVQALSPAKKPNYQAIMLGPQGAVALPIGRGDGPEVIDLWQRWTTPEPRVDLAGERRPSRALRAAGV